MKQVLVNIVLFLWPVMPMKLRIWAFWNDKDIEDLKPKDLK